MTQAKLPNNHSKPLSSEWFAGDAIEIAPKLLGKIIRKGSCAGIIVETEAYTTDPASHAYHLTKRSMPMRDTYGHWYVYFTYGMHHCVNITTNKGGSGAVLIRAVEPTDGIALMQRRRNIRTSTLGRSDLPRVGRSNIPKENLCSGPAKLCQAFAISTHENLLPAQKDFVIYDAPELTLEEIGVSGRIGIKKGTELPWRFYIKGSKYLSR